MRKKISILAVIVLVAACVATLVACNFNGGGQTGGGTTDFDGVCMHIDANGDKVCDKCYRDMDGYCVHIDDDNDGLCDKCTQNVVVQVDFFAMNDLHGMYADTSTQPGVDELTTYLKNKQESGHTVVLSSGDMWQGSSESNNTKGKLATEWLNYIDCAAMTLGNHEFDWKTDKIKTNAQLANFPFLAINVYERATNKIAPYCQPSIIVKKGGAKIGIIGAIGDCYSSISSSMCQDVFFKTGSQLTALIKAESAKLKKQGADYIALSIHDGYGESTSSMRSIRDKDLTWYDASLSNGYIDVVFEGHTHQSYVLVDTYGVKHIQAGGYNDAISHAGVTVNFANGNKSTTANVVSNYEYSTVESDSIINDLVNKYRSEIGYPDTVVGYNGSYRSYDALRTLMAKAYLLKGQKTWGDEYDIALAGGYLKPRDPYNLPSGNVTIRQIQSLFPFDNEMHLCSIKGSDLLDRYFNNSSYVYARGTKASTIETNLKNGIGLDKTYYIVTDSYNTDYATNRLTVVKTLGTTAYPRDCFIEYIQAGKDGFKALDCTHVDANTDGKCDDCNVKYTDCTHIDADTNGVCDKCGEIIGECSHVDADKNGKCDKCGATVEVVCNKHIDEDGNGVCDNCRVTFVCSHADANNDDICDECRRNLIVLFTFFAINDLHGMYADTSTQPGVDELTTYLLNAQNNGYSLVLASGDMWQGSTESNNTKGKLATEWLNYVNCTSMTLGNHEFDWKTDKIKTNAQLANFPFLAINVYDNSTNRRVSYCQPSTVVTMGGIKIGIIGAIGDCYSSISASMCSDVNFKTGSALTALVKAEATRLRNEEGVNYIIYSIHDGYSGSSSSLQDISDSAMSKWYDASLSNGYVDVVFEGHTHSSYTLRDSYGVYHAQGGGYNDGISQATLSYNILTGQKVTTVSIIANSVYKTEKSDDIINRLIEKYADEIGDPNEVVGYNDTYRNSSALTAAMAKAYLMKGQSVWGANYDIVLAGGYLNVRDPSCLPVGNVTVGQIQTLFPFDNEMQLCSIKGSDLLSRYFNNSSYVYEKGTNASTIEADLRSGSGLNDTYYIVTDSYNSDYTKNNLTVVKTLGTTAYPRDCIIEYIKAGKFGTQCSGHVDADSDGICDKCSKSFICANHVDTDGDYKCDQCSAHIHADANSDGKCDGCGAAVSNHTCADADGDYKCDECSEYMPNVYTVSKALALASTLGSGESTESIIIVGKIKSISNTTYGNCYIEDDKGNQLFVYGIYDESGSKYNALSYKPQVGDTIVMYGSILYYNGTTLELNRGVLKWCSGNA